MDRRIRRDRFNRVDVGTLVLVARLFATMVALVRRNRRAVDARQANDSHLATIVEGSSDAIISATLDGEVLTWNSGARAMFGYTAEEMTGQSMRRIVSPQHAHHQAELARQVRQGKAVSCSEGTRLRKDGTSVAVSVTVSPLWE